MTQNETDINAGIGRDGIAGKALNIVEEAGGKVEAALGADHLVVRKTKKVWQYFLLYPAVFAAIIGSIPTGINIYKSVKYGVATSDVAHAEEQKALWIKNLHCVQNLSYQTMQTDDGATVQIGACKNGDVLIEIIPANSVSSIAEWVSINRVRSASTLGALFVSRAYAADRYGNMVVAQAGIETMCSKMNPDTGIMVRVIKRGDKCFREEVDTLKGKVLKKEVACNIGCN